MTLSAYRKPRRAVDGTRYAPWVATLQGKCGVYVIRDASSRQVLYIGESHKGRLRQTLTRHFSSWGRSKSFWSGWFGGGSADPGFTYDPGAVVVAVEVTRADRAIARQNALIRSMRPRDNTIGKPTADDDDDVPF